MTGAQILSVVRSQIVESSATYWSDAELLAWLNMGCKALWRKLVGTRQDLFFQTEDGCSIIANTLELQSVPSNVSIVIGLEPVSPSSYPAMNFFPRRFNHADMIGARAASPIDASQAARMYYAVTGVGAPVGAPTINIAPKLNGTVPVLLIYVPTCPEIVLTSPSGTQTLSNPIPCESDDALAAWTTAYALGKEPTSGGARIPDPGWMAIYQQQETSIITFINPRTDDEPEVAEGLHEIFLEE